MGPGFISTSPARIKNSSRLVPLEGLKLRSPDSSSGRASASEAVGCGLNPRRAITKALKPPLLTLALKR